MKDRGATLAPVAQRVLIVDDDANLRTALAYSLRQEGLLVLTAEDGKTALDAFHRDRPDVLVLDVMLPALDGLEVCRRIRAESDVPILMLTARDTEVDRVVGLEIGADDYLGKPFSTRELVARVRALLRRVRPRAAAAGERHEAGGLVLDQVRHRVTRDGEEVALTPKEFDLLAFLMAHPGQVFAREQLLTSVWGYDFAGDSRTVDTHVKTLRDKLGDTAERPRWLETLRGVGYRFRESAR
jgi:DNA-binding response OmpR family regulator